ncbi:MAG: hypothetical protein E6H92_06470 [Chloroflexi bacterium]|nr:MAG: hypothetical protein E6H92_06470 [Chloroflexota bacterium]
MTHDPSDPRYVDTPQESRVRERIQQEERKHSLRPGGLCPHCGGHAFRRAELKAKSVCPKCGKSPQAAA